MIRVAVAILAGLTLMGAAWGEGWLAATIDADTTGIVWAIAGCAALGLACAFLGRMQAVQVLEYACVTLGLVGTVVGFIIAFSAVDADSAADVAQVPAMVGAVIAGMGISLYTTLVGALAALWLHVAAAVHA